MVWASMSRRARAPGPPGGVGVGDDVAELGQLRAPGLAADLVGDQVGGGLGGGARVIEPLADGAARGL
jgi:hypothetical protein